MDETMSTVTKQRVDGEGLTLRLGQREYYRYGGDHRWFEQPSGKPVGQELQVLLDELEPLAHELAAVEPKPLDVDDVYADLLDALLAADAALEEELGRPPTPTDRDRLCPSELADQLYGRSDSVAVAAVTEALGRPYLVWGSSGHTVASTFRGEQECC